MLPRAYSTFVVLGTWWLFNIYCRISEQMDESAKPLKRRWGARKSAKTSAKTIINDTELEGPGEGGNGREQQYLLIPQTLT